MGCVIPGLAALWSHCMVRRAGAAGLLGTLTKGGGRSEEEALLVWPISDTRASDPLPGSGRPKSSKLASSLVHLPLACVRTSMSDHSYLICLQQVVCAKGTASRLANAEREKTHRSHKKGAHLLITSNTSTRLWLAW
eukprot:scaffold199640_cov21-Tisochrysis_lutea.AAC.1